MTYKKILTIETITRDGTESCVSGNKKQLKEMGQDHAFLEIRCPR